MSGKGSIHIGTSGWNYPHWKGKFYPDGMSSEELLPHYAGVFSTVEINNSFYRLPERSTFKNWRNTVAGDFIFSVKASRYITHMKNLKDAEESLEKLLDAVQGLQDKLGVILFQLPPKWNINVERFSNFVKLLPVDYNFAFEFRNGTWHDERIYELLEENNLSFCIYHLAGSLSPEKVTSGTVYVRLHGPSDQAYQGKYSEEEIKNWASRIKSWSNENKSVFCYFDNDQSGYAAENAEELKNLI